MIAKMCSLSIFVNNLKNILFLFIASIVLSTVGIADLYFQYLIYFIFLIIFLFLLLAKRSIVLPRMQYLCYLPAFSILVWVYGLFLAIFNSIPFEAYTRNFAALLFYGFFYILILIRPKLDALRRVFIWLAVIYALISLFAILENNVGLFDFDVQTEAGFGVFRLYYSIGTVCLFIPLMHLFFTLAAGNQNSIYNRGSLYGYGSFFDVLLFILFLLIIFLNGSKGYVASLLFSCLFFIVYRLVNLRRSQLVGNLLIIFGSLFIFFLCFYYFEIFEFILKLEFDEDHPRSIQGRELIDDFTIFGNGLGASITNGYSRDELGYGFELSYHNVIHKFGIFSTIIFAVIFYPFAVSVVNILLNRKLSSSIFAFSLMIYVIPAYGNPFLISPITVMFNVLALYSVLFFSENSSST